MNFDDIIIPQPDGLAIISSTASYQNLLWGPADGWYVFPYDYFVGYTGGEGLVPGTTSRNNSASGIFDNTYDKQYYFRPAAPGASLDFIRVNAASLYYSSTAEANSALVLEGWRGGTKVATHTVAIKSSASVTVQLPGGFVGLDEVRLYTTAPGCTFFCDVFFVVDDLVIVLHAPSSLSP